MCGPSVRRSAAVSSVAVVMYATICLCVFTASQAAAMVTGTPAVGDFRDSTTMTSYGDEEEVESESPSMGMAPAAAAAATASVSDGGFSNSGWTTESAGVTSMTTTFEDYSAGGYFPRDRMGPPSMNSHYLTPSAYHKDKLKSTEENIILRAPSISSLSSTSSVSVTETSLTHSMGAIAKPTKYHYYPHNQHMYLLPECAVQQVCSAVYVRLNYTQPLCACPSRYREPCSASLNSDDLHTTELSVDSKGKILTLVKTCEPVKDMRLCRAPRDWSLLALQNVRTGKSHYLVICHCPDSSILEGPTSHDQPTYASVPGIKVYGMVCISKSDDTNESQLKRKVRLLNSIQGENETNNANDATKKLKFPYEQFQTLLKYVNS